MDILATILGIGTSIGGFFMNLFGMKQSKEQYDAQIAAQKAYQQQQLALSLTDLSANIEIIGSNLEALTGEKERVLGAGGLFAQQTTEVKKYKELAGAISGVKGESGSSEAVIEEFLRKRGEERFTLETEYTTAIANLGVQEEAAESSMDILIKGDEKLQGPLGYLDPSNKRASENEEYMFETAKKYVEYTYGISFTKEDWDRLKNPDLAWGGF